MSSQENQMQEEIEPGTALVNVNIQVPPPVMRNAQSFLVSVREFSVATADDYKELAHSRATISARWSALEKQRTDLKAPILEAGSKIDLFFKPAQTVLLQAKEIATHKLVTWETEQRNIAAEKQRIANEKARLEREQAERLVREERDRQAVLQREQERLEHEAKLAAEKSQREAAEAQVIQERARREAAEAQASGDRERAAQAEREVSESRMAQIKARANLFRVQEMAEQQRVENERLQAEANKRATELETKTDITTAPVIKEDIPEVAGLSRARVYKWRLVDKSKVKADYLILDEKTINRVVASAKDRATDIIGGIEVYMESNLRQR